MRIINNGLDYLKNSVKSAIIHTRLAASIVLDGSPMNEIRDLIIIKQEKLIRNNTKRFCQYYHRKRRFKSHNIDIRWIKENFGY